MDISARNILIFDIETVGDVFDDLPEEEKSYLIGYASSEDRKTEIIESMVFNPLTSKIAAIGMLDHVTSKGCVMVNTEPGIVLQNNYENFTYVSGTESDLLRKFWEVITKKEYNLFVTFNGREFDCPFLMLRSVFHGIKPGYNLMRGSDWTFREYHIDLLKEFTFFTHRGRGARRKFSLDFYCRKFGIQSPKRNGISGDAVGRLYSEKRYQDIADYCIGDVLGERELFKFWNEYFNI